MADRLAGGPGVERSKVQPTCSRVSRRRSTCAAFLVLSRAFRVVGQDGPVFLHIGRI